MRRSTLLTHLALLLLVWLIGIFIYLSTTDFFIKKLDVVVMAAVYPIWGTWHHWEKGRVNLTVILEYLLVALIVMVGLLAILPSS